VSLRNSSRRSRSTMRSHGTFSRPPFLKDLTPSLLKPSRRPMALPLLPAVYRVAYGACWDSRTRRSELITNRYITLNFLCKDSACPYSKIGFRNVRALKKHLQDFLPPSVVAEVPDLLHDSRVSVEDDADSSDTAERTDVQDGNDLGLSPELNRHPQLQNTQIELHSSFAISTTRWD
jgi:hypothetical protein